MLKVNEYFDGNVKSIALTNEEGNATVGVMEPGVYEFGTSSIEYMTIISGALTVRLPGETEWKIHRRGESFIVPSNTKFKVEVVDQTAYICFYR